MPRDWEGVSVGSGAYSNNGYTYDYMCKITKNPISFHTGDVSSSISSIACTLIEKGTTTDSGDSGNDSEQTELGSTLYDSVTLSADNNWSYTFTNLPLSGTDDDGNTVSYTYYVQEVSVSGYDTTYKNNGGISSGTITVINQKQDTPETPSYELPETGGAGTSLFTMGGAALAALSLLFGTRQRRRGERRVRH